jgi:2-amino-4-hydroxy-6-hydroxymethyldihydropteridine diphosphokinase
MSTVYIGIGSNLGDRHANIQRALEKIKSRKDMQLGVISSVIETDPVGDVSQPKFLNACCRIDTGLYPDEVLNALKSIEREMGRHRDSAPRKLNNEERLKALSEGKTLESFLKKDEPAATTCDKWAPRIIDLDILLYDDIIVKGINLTIPHQLMHERVFALEPLAQIAPDAVHPVIKKTIKQMLDERQSDAGLTREDVKQADREQI